MEDNLKFISKSFKVLMIFDSSIFQGHWKINDKNYIIHVSCHYVYDNKIWKEPAEPQIEKRWIWFIHIIEYFVVYINDNKDL